MKYDYFDIKIIKSIMNGCYIMKKFRVTYDFAIAKLKMTLKIDQLNLLM